MEQQEELIKAEVLLAAAKWIFAKTLAHIPHHYTLKKDWADPAEFEFVCAMVKKYPTKLKFKNRTYNYLVIGEYQYWTMERPWETPILMNRAKIETV